MRIGIFGGTFNPPHSGHLRVAEHVRSNVKLDTVIFIPSYSTPHKGEGESELAHERLAMTRLAISANPFFQVSDIEVRMKNVSYTVQTLEKFAELYPHDRFFLLIGMDNYLTFHQWKDPEIVRKYATLLVMTRPGIPHHVNPAIGTDNVEFIDVPALDISSSDIRKRVRQKLPIQDLVPASVEQYIIQEKLYI